MRILGQILWRNWFGIAIALIFLYFLAQECENGRIKDQNIEALTEQNTTYRNGLGTITTKAKTVQLSVRDFKKLVQNKNDTIAILVKSFSSVKSVVKTNTIVQIDSIIVPFEIPVKCSFVREDSIKHNWYSFRYRVDSLGFRIDSLKIPNTQVVATGLQRKWFLGKTTLVTEVSNTNPFIKNANTQSFQTTVKVPWYESRTAAFIAGALTIKAAQELTKK